MRPTLLVVLAAVLVFPPVASAGGYSVTACLGPENGSWAEWEPSPFATAYTACPGGAWDLRRPQSNEGMMVRNVVGAGFAPRDAAAAMRFDAPRGTVITGLDADVRITSNPGWDAGIHDAWNDRWLWCGSSCWSSFHHWMHEELRGLSTQRIQALVRCAAERCRRDARHGFVAIRNVRVYLEDPSAPRLEGLRGSLLAGGEAWLRGGGDAAFDAFDNSGVRVARIELDGRVVHEDARACDFARPVPCADGGTGAGLDTRAWGDGEHVMRFAAVDAGGNWAWVDRVVRVDNTPPAEVAPVLEGGPGWSPLRARRLTLPLPGGQAAPLVRARVTACRVGGACEDSAPALGASSGAAGAAAVPPPRDSSGAANAAAVPVAAFDGPGEYSVRVALEDAAGNVGAFSPPVTMRFDDTRPGAPDVSAADAWRNGGALPLDATGARPVSGIRGYRVRIGGRDAVVATSVPLDDLPEGGTPVEVTAISGAGLEGTAVRTLLRLDRSRPSATAEGAPEGWSREPVRLALRGRDQPALAGVRSLAWQVDGEPESSAEGDAAQVEVADDGRHTVSYRAVDGAGNESEPRAVAVKVDRTPPETVVFEAPDPADPRRVRVVVADRTSGVASGRIELRRAGGDWSPVRTTFEADRLVAMLDDARLPAGPYELRALVADVAGNETVGTSRADGTPVVLTLPLRRRTSMAVRRAGRLLRARLRAGAEPLAGREVTLTQRLRGRTRWRRVCARRTVVIPRAVSATPAAGSTPATSSAVTSAPSPASRPPALAASPPSPAASPPSPAACTLRTDSAGRVDVRLPAGPSRKLRVSFAGDALLLPARGSTAIRTRARARLRATPAVVSAGGLVRFAGRLLGRHVPRAGKLVELQARVGARWRTFATLRSDRRGRVRHRHRFALSSSGSTYELRLRVPRERSYPFETGTSRAITVRVL
jgi:hypothetical protein